MNSDKQSINNIKWFLSMQTAVKRPVVPLSRDDEEAIGRIAGLGLAILKEIHRLRKGMGKLNIDLKHPPAGLSEKRRTAIKNALGRLFIAQCKLNAFVKILREAEEYNRKTTKRKTRIQICAEACQAVLTATDAAVQQMGFDLCKGYTPRRNDPTPEELAHDFLTSWVARDSIGNVKNDVERRKPDNVPDATLLELRTGVYMQEPDKVAPEQFALIPKNVRGKKEGAAGINRTTEDRIRGMGLKPVTDSEEWDMTQEDNTAVWLKGFIAQEEAAAILSDVKLSKREQQYIDVVLTNAELYLDPDGGNIAAAKEMNVTANNLAQIKKTCFNKIKIAAGESAA